MTSASLSQAELLQSPKDEVGGGTGGRYVTVAGSGGGGGAVVGGGGLGGPLRRPKSSICAFGLCAIQLWRRVVGINPLLIR